MLYENPWPIAGPALIGVLTIMLAVELLVAMVRFAVRDDRDGADS